MKAKWPCVKRAQTKRLILKICNITCNRTWFYKSCFGRIKRDFILLDSGPKIQTTKKGNNAYTWLTFINRAMLEILLFSVFGNKENCVVLVMGDFTLWFLLYRQKIRFSSGGFFLWHQSRKIFFNPSRLRLPSHRLAWVG